MSKAIDTTAPEPDPPQPPASGGSGLAPAGRLITVSVFSADEPIGKRRGLNANGSLRKVATSPRLQSVRQIAFDTIEAFANYALKAPASEALTFGLCALPEARVAVGDADKREDVVARTARYFAFQAQPGVLLLDCDVLPGEQPLSAGEIADALRAAVPELRNVAMAAKPSSSAHLHAPNGAELVGPAGVHIFVGVHDATRIPALGNAIAERLWLAGHGRIKITGNGRRLHATLIDTSVWSPERLCFTRAACEDGLEQRFGEISYFPGECDDLTGETWLDDLPPLTDEERARLAEAKALAYAEAEPIARATREKWADQQVAKRATLALRRGEQIDPDAVRSSLLCGEHVLPPDLVLYPLGAEPLTAGEMFSAGADWDGARLADPFEPSYGNGDPRIALAVFNCSEPHIHSHAHGGQRYLFRSESERYAEVAADFEDLGPLPGENSMMATPYVRRDPRKIPMRPWLYGRQIMRGAVSLVVAPGATGKTALLVGTSLALAAGRPLLGKEVHDGPKRVWLWNLEDSAEELARMIEAACLRWALADQDIGNRLFVDSGVDGLDLCTATADRNGFKLLSPVMDSLVAALRASRIDVLIIDPFVSSHRVPENDNGAIDAVAKAWARVAAEAQCAVVLAHHTTKAAGVEVTAERARGASALVNAARSVLALNRMTSDEAGKLGISEGERRRFFRAYDDKNNRAPPAETSDWFRLESVPLGNAPDPFDHGDDIQVVVPWTPPRASDGIEESDVMGVQEKIAVSQWRKSEQSPQWAGRAVADVLGLDIDAPGVRQRIRTLLKGWIADGSLGEEMIPDGNRIPRPCIVVGRWVEAGCNTCASPMQTGGASAAKPAAHHPHPFRGGGAADAGDAMQPQTFRRTSHDQSIARWAPDDLHAGARGFDM